MLIVYLVNKPMITEYHTLTAIGPRRLHSSNRRRAAVQLEVRLHL